MGNIQGRPPSRTHGQSSSYLLARPVPIAIYLQQACQAFDPPLIAGRGHAWCVSICFTRLPPLSGNTNEVAYVIDSVEDASGQHERTLAIHLYTYVAAPTGTNQDSTVAT